ncbi:MAG: hypothetical protein ACI865_002038 [Flavobacteriaceae bacterium]|jgi:uncharacterized protein involved in outer membrane biogenesis
MAKRVKKEKKKKSWLRRILKWTGISLLLIIIALILIPILFKDELKELVIAEVNKELNAELSLGDFDLTFISTFPDMTIQLIDAKLQGIGDFKDVTLMDIKEINAEVAFWSVVSGDQVEIDAVHIIDPVFDVRVLQDGLANYDIVKADSSKTPEEIEEPSSFKLSLKEYSITNAMINYDDQASNMHAKIKNFTHTGSGDLTADVIDFETTTTMDELSYDMDGVSYLSETKTDATLNLLMEFTEKSSKFTLKENKITLNELGFSIDGFYEMLENHDNMDLKLNASQATFKQFLSLIPSFYQTGYESMVSSGNLKLNGVVKGKLNETDLPGWDFGMVVSNASINYADLPGKITNIQMDAGSKYPGGANLDAMTVNVKKMHANMGDNTVDATLAMKQLMSDPFIQSTIKANVDLATLKDFVPMTEGESYSGILDADVDIKGAMSALDAEDFEAFTAKGNLTLADVVYKSADLPDDVTLSKMGFEFSPQNLALTELDAKMGTSDFKMSGTIDNYLGYALRDEPLKGAFDFKSNNLDLDRLMGTSEEPAAGNGSTETTTEASTDPVLLPDNIDFNLTTTIDKVKYNGIDVKNVRGKVRLAEETATLENLTMDAMGGRIGLTGAYNTQDHSKAALNFGYKLEKIDIQELVKNFVTVGKLAPVMKYAHGKISSDFEMKSDLTSSFEPILTSLTSVGDVSSNSIVIKGMDVFKRISEKTKLKGFSSQALKNFYTKFKIKDGKLELTPFDVKIGDYSTNVSGHSTLEKSVDYLMKMDIRKDQIPAEMIKMVEDKMKQLNSLVPKLDLGGLPDIIPVKIQVVGDIKKPEIKTDMREAILKATGDFKDDLIETVTEAIKDTVEAIITETVEEIKEDFEAKKQKILADAQKKADQVKAEAKRAADATRAEGNKQADELIKQAGNNPIKKKIAEASAKKLRDQSEQKAQKLESEGQKKADGIMSKAREEAAKLG